MYQTSKFAGAVRYNVPKNCAALLCRACEELPVCVAVRYLTLRIGCERYGRKNPLPYPFSKRSHIGNLRQIRKQGKGRSSKRKENRRLSFLFAPAAGAARSRRPQTANPPLRFSGKLPAPLGANTLTQFAHPAQQVQKRSRPVRGEPANAVRVPRSAGAEKGAARQGEHADAVRAPRSAGAEKTAARTG